MKFFIVLNFKYFAIDKKHLKLKTPNKNEYCLQTV